MSLVSERKAIQPLPVLQDNIIWIWSRGSEAVVVDPAVAEPVIQTLQQQKLTLIAVLQTYHHADHIGGTPALLHEWPQAAVIASGQDRRRIPFQTQSVSPGARFHLLGMPVDVIDVRAHTSAHLAFVLPDGCSPAETTPALFCGDTLFSGGCGRLFEGSPDDMHRALQTLAALPESTRVYCAHEYTEGNLHWAHALKPDDQAIKARLKDVVELRSHGQLTVPSTIGEERRSNLFLRAESAEELGDLRELKDAWRGL
jgi:hydroxyacylglutathione hydrolase